MFGIFWTMFIIASCFVESVKNVSWNSENKNEAKQKRKNIIWIGKEIQEVLIMTIKY